TISTNHELAPASASALTHVNENCFEEKSSVDQQASLSFLNGRKQKKQLQSKTLGTYTSKNSKPSYQQQIDFTINERRDNPEQAVKKKMKRKSKGNNLNNDIEDSVENSKSDILKKKKFGAKSKSTTEVIEKNKSKVTSFEVEA